MKKAIAVILLAVIMLCSFYVSVNAEPTDSFSRYAKKSGASYTGLAQDMYAASMFINATTLNLEKPLSGLRDICCDNDGYVYILASDRSRVIILNPDYTLKADLKFTESDGSEADFSGANGVFVDKSKKIYICDTQHSRILVCNSNGNVEKIMETPESDIIPKDFYYQPYRMAIDDKGYTYILSLGCYYGALAYSPEGEFLGFCGSNIIETSVVSVISFLWNKLTKNDKKKSASVKKLPYSFVDLALDSEGYLVTCTGRTDENTNGHGQIRKISAGGQNILYNRDSKGGSSTSDGLNFLEEEVLKKFGHNIIQNIVSIDVDDDNFIYALDQTYSLIYVYDDNCNLLGGFGGGAQKAKQLGLFSMPVSIKVHGDDLLIADIESEAVTVYHVTQYGSLLKKAQSLYLKGNYAAAKPYYNEVLSYDRSNQLANRGLAMACYVEGNYDAAIQYAKNGMDYVVYDLAWQAILKRFLAEHFLIILFGILLLAGSVVLLVVKGKKYISIKNAKVKCALVSPFHPFDAFAQIKEKNLCSYKITGIFLAIFFISELFKDIWSGFLFSSYSPADFSIFIKLLSTVGVVVLWTVSNWLIASLLMGNGSFKEVFTATVYSLIPLTVYNFVFLIFSQFLPLSASGLLSGLHIAVLLYTFFLFSVSFMEVHEYGFFKFLYTGIISVLLMILIVFVIFLIGILYQQIAEVFSSVYREITYR